jgi:carboxymethylenebutenolidase
MAVQMLEVPAIDGRGTFHGYLSLPPAGHGPGLVLAQEIFGVNQTMREIADHYAAEGYVVFVPDLFWRQQPGIELGYTPDEWQKAFSFYQDFDEAKGVEDIQASISTLRNHHAVIGKVGVVGFCLGGKLAYLAACRTDTDVAISYYGVGIETAIKEAKNVQCKLLLHLAQNDEYCLPDAQETILQSLRNKPNFKLYVYAGVKHAFARVDGPHYDKASAEIAHARSIEALKSEIGPQPDLSALWDRHCEYEFGTHDVAATMATMVPEPYVNHIPTMTGGVGYQQVQHFYKNHFVNSNPADTSLILISRTVGATQVVDEMLFCFTHTCEIPWMLPGIPPTHKRVEIPVVAVVKFRGDKVCHEHIYWDQASVLVQIGALDATGLPIAGVQTAHKLLDPTLPSNSLITSWADLDKR